MRGAALTQSKSVLLFEISGQLFQASDNVMNALL